MMRDDTYSMMGAFRTRERRPHGVFGLLFLAGQTFGILRSQDQFALKDCQSLIDHTCAMVCRVFLESGRSITVIVPQAEL
jgi:hypothetical protein